MLEIEKRGILTKKEYDNLLHFFEKKAISLGDDNKDVVYYIYNNKLLKIVDNASKGNSKISLKMNKIGNGSVFPETEVIFSRKDFEKVKFILDTITNPEKIMTGIQKRKNFIYKNCEFAVKWSKYWGYHFEVEKLVEVEDKEKIRQANNDLDSITKELNIKTMSDNELKIFTKKAEKLKINSLRDLLLEKNKPKYQHNDKESVEWIKINQPIFSISKLEISKILTIIKKIINIGPWNFFEKNFYVNNQVLKGIHGENHAIRVSIYVLLVYLTTKNIKNINLNDLIFCALFHDCSRTNDNSDKNHGGRSIKILKRYAQKYNLKLKNIDGIVSAINFHNIEYKEILNNKNYVKNKVFCDLLKVADSLDRYRFPKINWWIKNDYLNIIPSDIIKKVAFVLTSNTELDYIESGKVDYKKNLEVLKKELQN